jgi:hypothetical protein
MRRFGAKLGPGGRPYRMPVARPQVIPGPEVSPWYWNPNRFGIKLAPESFRDQLHNLGEELEATWNPVKERWQLWARTNAIQSKLCSGWRLLFIHSGPSGEYLPLDERVLARLYHASALKHGDARKYFDRVASEIMRDREKAEQDQYQDTMDRAMERGWDYTRIKNIGRGSKFSNYHA